MSECKSCGAAVFFVRTAGGKFMPLDKEPSDKGNILYDDAFGTCEVIANPVHGNGVEFYTSHFATCPNAAQHRKQPSARAQPRQPKVSLEAIAEAFQRAKGEL
jgi:hypothetical protein